MRCLLFASRAMNGYSFGVCCGNCFARREEREGAEGTDRGGKHWWGLTLMWRRRIIKKKYLKMRNFEGWGEGRFNA